MTPLSRWISKAASFLCGAAFLFAPFGAGANPPALRFPVDCRLGEDCFIQQYVDHDAGAGARDYTCGGQSYDGHQGTDFRLADLAALARNVAVLAAADGVVRATRDGVADQGIAAMPEGQDCGNGVVIDHADGWQSQYCHLAQGSVIVQSGQSVTAGTPLGAIGLSGRSEFPHLHMTLRHEGVVIDPFNASPEGACGLTAAQLWQPALPAPTADVMSVGFATGLPEYSAIQEGRAHQSTAPRDSAALVLWAYAHSGRIGDVMHLRITGPDGAVIHETDVLLQRAQAQFFRASGRRTPSGGWPAGRYEGAVSLIRDGAVISTRRGTITLD